MFKRISDNLKKILKKNIKKNKDKKYKPFISKLSKDIMLNIMQYSETEKTDLNYIIDKIGINNFNKISKQNKNIIIKTKYKIMLKFLYFLNNINVPKYLYCFEFYEFFDYYYMSLLKLPYQYIYEYFNFIYLLINGIPDEYELFYISNGIQINDTTYDLLTDILEYYKRFTELRKIWIMIIVLHFGIIEVFLFLFYFELLLELKYYMKMLYFVYIFQNQY